MGLMVFVEWKFLDPRDEVKSHNKAKLEEKIKKILNWTSYAEINSTGLIDDTTPVKPAGIR